MIWYIYYGMVFASVSKETASTTLGVKLTQWEGKLPKVVLTSDYGSEAEIYLFRGCVTSWKVASGKDLLFVRPGVVFSKKKTYQQESYQPSDVKSNANPNDQHHI